LSAEGAGDAFSTRFPFLGASSASPDSHFGAAPHTSHIPHDSHFGVSPKCRQIWPMAALADFGEAAHV